jgi:hypothetical protein
MPGFDRRIQYPHDGLNCTFLSVIKKAIQPVTENYNGIIGMQEQLKVDFSLTLF